MDSGPKKTMVIQSEAALENNLDLIPAGTVTTKFEEDPEKQRKLEEKIDATERLVCIVSAAKAPTKIFHALRYALAKVEDGEDYDIRLYLKLDAENTDPSVLQMRDEFCGDERIECHIFEAQEEFEESIAKYKAFTSGPLAKVYRLRSSKAQKAGNTVNALKLRKKALELEKDKPPTKATALDHIVIGMRYIDLKEYHNAERELIKSLEIAKSLEEFGVEAGAREQLGVVYFAKGDCARAEESCLEAIRLSEPGNKPKTLAYLYRLLGKIYNKQHRFDLAEKTWRKALSFGAEADSAEAVARANELLAILTFKSKRYKEAIEFRKAALDAAKKTNDQPNVALSLMALVILYYKTKQWKLGEEALGEAKAIYTELQDFESIQRCDKLAGAFQNRSRTMILFAGRILLLVVLVAWWLFDIIKNLHK